jgi:hypothetical protein
MRILKWFLGYTWAGATIIIALATFAGYSYFSQVFADVTGININHRYSGGEILRIVDHGNYKTIIHRPVFDSLIGQAEEGFVQINWEPAAGLTQVLNEGFDYNNDGKEDFSIILNTVTEEVILTAANPSVLSVEKAYKLRNGRAVRVLLKRQS